MQVDRYERYWMWAASGMLVLFLGAIVLTAVTGSAHPPSHVETINPETLDRQRGVLHAWCRDQP